ncbi:HBL/NHE enterotoxin family protein [Paraburkholderia sp. CI3]|uniref:HBL/NHE enterotoxin family protein n=1 Tax=Paraburkholderia sp. CI3 TaxID=2991060 RepID=UPI003D1C56EB
MPDISGNATAIGDANTQQMGAALTVQTYANSVLEQPQVDFSGIDGLSQYQTQINDGLTTAKGHAIYYLDTLQPSLIENMANIDNYYQLNKALPATLPAGSTVAEWAAALTAVQQESVKYQGAANQIVTNLQTLGANLTTDSADFTTTVTNMNSAVGGADGILATIKGELSKFQAEIDGAIAGIVLSGLAVVGGVFVICVGAIAEFVTAGASTSAVIGGVGIVLVGVLGEAGSAAGLVAANKAKASLLTEQADLKEEVKLATAISGGYTSLSTQVNGAITAASAMANAWESITSDLGDIIADLNNGISNADEIRTLYINAANGEIGTLLADIQTVKGQMAGVTVQSAAAQQTVSDLIAKVANLPASAGVA